MRLRVQYSSYDLGAGGTVERCTGGKTLNFFINPEPGWLSFSPRCVVASYDLGSISMALRFAALGGRTARG